VPAAGLVPGACSWPGGLVPGACSWPGGLVAWCLVPAAGLVAPINRRALLVAIFTAGYVAIVA